LLVEGIRIAFLVDVGLAVARVLVAIVIVGGGSTRQRSIPLLRRRCVHGRGCGVKPGLPPSDQAISG
jgi:hypothetical protein